MDFHLTKEQEMLRKMYREFAENEVKPLAEEIDEEERFPMETVEKMAKLGMMGIYFPQQYGGAGADVLAYAIFSTVSMGKRSSSSISSARGLTSVSANSRYILRSISCSLLKTKSINYPPCVFTQYFKNFAN